MMHITQALRERPNDTSVVSQAIDCIERLEAKSDCFDNALVALLLSGDINQTAIDFINSIRK